MMIKDINKYNMNNNFKKGTTTAMEMKRITMRKQLGGRSKIKDNMQYIWGNLQREQGKGRELELDSAALLFVSILVREGKGRGYQTGAPVWKILTASLKMVSPIRGDNQLLLTRIEPLPRRYAVVCCYCSVPAEV